MKTLLLLLALGPIPKLAPPDGIPVTPERIALGQKLFFDERLSFDATVSCATCHRPDHGFADGNAQAVGVLGRTGTRNSPTIINASFSPLMFHDGRTVGLQTQSLQPILNRLEMGGQSENQVLNRLRSIPGYVDLFNRAYGPRQNPNQAITRERYGHAFASFESTIVSFDAPIDRRLDGQPVLSDSAEIGYGLFLKADCMSCHKPPLFTDLAFHNNGMEYAGKANPNDDGRFAIIRNSNRFSQQQKIASIRAFKTPTLREIARTAPYNHAGTFPDLQRVLGHYNSGGAKIVNGVALRDSAIDPRIRPLGYTQQQLDYLERFLVEAFASPSYPDIRRPVLP